METALATKDSELIQERQIKEELMNQAFNVAQSQDTERKRLFHFYKYFSIIILFMYFFLEKERDEKFAKLKDVYYKLRNTHITILREVYSFFNYYFRIY